MADRKAAARIPGAVTALTGGDMASFARLVEQCPPIAGRLVDIVFDNSTDGYARHGLGRRMLGAQAVGYSSDAMPVPVPMAPATAAEFFRDPATWVSFSSGATPYTGTVTAWVF